MVLALHELSRAGRSPAAAGRQSGHAPEHLSGAAPKSRPDSASPDAQSCSKALLAFQLRFQACVKIACVQLCFHNGEGTILKRSNAFKSRRYILYIDLARGPAGKVGIRRGPGKQNRTNRKYKAVHRNELSLLGPRSVVVTD